jgi:hypothetical protein
MNAGLEAGGLPVIATLKDRSNRLVPFVTVRTIAIETGGVQAADEEDKRGCARGRWSRQAHRRGTTRLEQAEPRSTTSHCAHGVFGGASDVVSFLPTPNCYPVANANCAPDAEHL